MTPDDDLRHKMQDDELAQLLHVLTVGRRWSIVRYVFLIACGVTSLLSPSTILLTQTTGTTTFVCSSLWIGCGVTCLVSVLRDRRTGEFFGIPGVCLGLVVWAGAMFVQAWTVSPITLPYGFALLTLAASLAKRETEVKALMDASEQFEGLNR